MFTCPPRPKSCTPAPDPPLEGSQRLCPTQRALPPTLAPIPDENCHVRKEGERPVPALQRQRPGTPSLHTAPSRRSPKGAHPPTQPVLRAGAEAGAGSGVFVPAAGAQRGDKGSAPTSPAQAEPRARQQSPQLRKGDNG